MSDDVWNPLEAPPDDPSLLVELRGRARPIELAVLGVAPVLLVVTFTVFDGATDWLVLVYDSPTPVSMVSAHFVHRSLAHLVANLAAYGVVAPVGYSLAVLSGRGREYVLAVAGFLIVLPPVLSGLILLTYDRGVAFGFSGVTMALVGVLAVFLGTFVDRRVHAVEAPGVAPGLFFLGLGFVAARTIPVTSYRLATVTAAVAIALVYLGWLLRPLPRLDDVRSAPGSQVSQFAIVGLGAFLLGLSMGFPHTPQRGAVVINTYGHLLGYAFGFVVPFSIFRLLESAPPAEEVDRGPV